MEDAYEMEVYSDSRNKGCEDWIDVGVPNEEYTKYGGFEVKSNKCIINKKRNGKTIKI